VAVMREDIATWRGRDLAASDGSKIGRIEEIYVDTETDEPEWALVHTGLLGTKQTFVPLRDATPDDDQLRVPYDKSQVKDAPSIEPDGQVSRSDEAELYRHYGLDYSETRSGEVGGDASGSQTDDAMTRSEEELRVGTREQESGRVRLRKYVVTDEVEQTVPVKREEVRLEREPITDANRDEAVSGEDLTEAEHEVTLHTEEPVVEKRTVPKERVRLDKDVEVKERTVSEEVRREEIDFDDSLSRDR
jgi:uncharacterized protein (TIGR02271 family)